MTKYLLLRNPGHNQVYFQSAATLAEKELTLSNLPVEEIALTTVANISYLSFQSPSPLSETELEIIARLSPTYALFQQESQDTLRPVPLPNPYTLEQSLASILKYQGKTNELFTKMLLNLALAQINTPVHQVKLLDPVAGKGTTLFQALSLGADAYAVECQEKSVTDGVNHLKKFLELERIKHKHHLLRVSGANKSFTAKKHTIDLGTEEQKQHCQFLNADSKFTAQLFPSKYFHIILGDLPYGIQHGNQAGGKQRSPAQLLSSCLRGWHTVLKDQGVLLLSWNLLVLPREKMCDLLLKNGFTPLESEALNHLSHQVDASILRDIILAKKS